MSLAPITEPAAPGALIRWVEVLVPASQLAERIAGTEFVPKAMRGKPDVVTACIMYGDEIGVGPMQALASIHVVDGRPFPSAELLRGMILRAGHTLTVHEMTGTRCRMSGLRAGAPEAERLTVEWTLDMARAAGLVGKDNWRKYPRAMLAARCTTDLVRLVFPDVIKGLGYLAETAEDATYLDTWATDEAPAPSTPKRAPVQRRTKPAPAQLHPAPTVAAEDDPLPDMPDPQPEPQPWEAPAQVNPRPDPRGPEAEERAAADVPGVHPPMLRALHAALTHVLPTGPDGTADRADRLSLLGAIVRRPLDTSKDLTRAEAMRCLDVLGAMQTGEATWEVPEHGPWLVIDLRRPPDVEDPPDG